MIGLKFRGRAPIKMAETVYDVANLKNEYAKTIMDRTEIINEDFISAIVAQGIMSYEGRNPQPALDEDGNFQCTDLDLLSFLVPIAARKAVIEIPTYQNRRKIIKKTGERKIGKNQFGPLVNLVSNKDVFSFSVKMHDKTIITKDLESGQEDVGAYRNYMIVDCDGLWYNGWDRIVWDPNAKENDFLLNNKLLTGNSVYFKYYVHPNRWQSVYGAPHLLKKMLIHRIDDEAGFYRKEVKRLLESGIEFPEGTKEKSRPIEENGNSEAIKVQTMEMILSIPNFSGQYNSAPNTQSGLIDAYNRQKLLTYTFKPVVQFTARANEAAFMKYGQVAVSPKIAWWMQNRTWTPFKKTPRSSEYQKMVLSNDMALMFRLKTKTEHVSAL